LKNSVSISFIILFILGLTQSLFANRGILHKSYAERQPFFVNNYYNNPIHKDSIQYFKEINRLQKLALDNDDRELYLETIFMRLNYLSDKNYKHYIPEITKLIQIADEENLIYLQIRTRQTLGFHYYYELNNYGKAIFYFLNSYEYIQQIKEADFPEKQEALSNIANICYNTGYENKSLKFLKEAKKYNYKHAPALIFNLMNTEGLIYQKYGQIKKAENIFKEILQKSTERSDTPWQILATGKLAALYYSQKKYDDALKILDNCPTIDKNKYDPIHYEKELFNHALLYIEIYLQKGDMSLFDEAMKKLMKNSSSTVKDLKMKQRLFFLYYKYFNYHNDLKKAISYSDSLILSQKQLNQIIHANSIKIAVEKDNYVRYVKKEQALKLERERSKKLKLFYLSTGFVLLSLILFIYTKKRRQYKLTITLQQKKLKEKEEEIKKAQLYLEKFIADNKKKDKIINELSEKITIENRQSLLDTIILTDEDWVKFKREFTIAYPHFFDKLKQISPKITPALERLAALLFIGLDNSQIANMLGIGKDSVARTKRRLRESLQILDDSDFKTWFESK
jgi:tetratricopeptide (TPR) repeat protein